VPLRRSEHIMRTHVAAGGQKKAAPRPRPAAGAEGGGGDDGGGGAGDTLSQRLRRATAAYADADALAVLSAGSGGSGGSWGSGGSGARPALLSHDALRKYIEYARRYCHPRLTRAAAKVGPPVLTPPLLPC